MIGGSNLIDVTGVSKIDCRINDIYYIEGLITPVLNGSEGNSSIVGDIDLGEIGFPLR